VKFLDARCAGKKTKIGHISSTGDVPAGQSCFMDEGSGATYLDRKFTSPPLSAIAIVGTDTSAPRVYEINYTFANDVVTAESNLGKALIAKYGVPTTTNYPIQMGWTDGDVVVRAACGSTEGPTGEFCTLSVSDTGLLDTERSIQQEADEAQEKQDAPPAPEL
jgi:hypothetical protein